MHEFKKGKISSYLIIALFMLIVLLCLSSLISSPVALILGFFFTWIFGHPFAQLNQKAVNWLLKIAVVGLGFGMNIQETLVIGMEGFSLTLYSIAFVLIAGYLLGRLLKVNRKTIHLISSGTAICGGSAIAAVSPIIKADEKQLSMSLAVVFLLNSIGLIVFPPLGHLLELTQHEFGLWSALAIHDTSSVVGAAHNYGEEALKVATTVKLARALWIIPLSILSVFLLKSNVKKVAIPWFILLFVIAILINSYIKLPLVFTTEIVSISKSLLILTLFLVGAGLTVDAIKTAGWKPMMLGISLWLLISVFSLFMVMF